MSGVPISIGAVAALAVAAGVVRRGSLSAQSPALVEPPALAELRRAAEWLAEDDPEWAEGGCADIAILERRRVGSRGQVPLFRNLPRVQRPAAPRVPKPAPKLTPEQIQGKMKGIARRAQVELRGRGTTLPLPTTFLDSGMRGGYVYETTDSGMIVRVGPAETSENEFLLLDEEFEGGVVRVFGILEIEGHIVTWKEKVDEAVEWFITRRYGHDDDPVGPRSRILSALSNLSPYSGSTRTALKTLSRYPETSGLARAIQNGLPSDDLDLSMNIGVNSGGFIVAFDP